MRSFLKKIVSRVWGGVVSLMKNKKHRYITLGALLVVFSFSVFLSQTIHHKKIEAAACMDFCTVTASAGTGGSVSPTSQSVVVDDYGYITVTPNTGYAYSAMGGTCPNKSYSSGTISFGPVIANCNISVSFAAIPSYTVSVSKTGTGTGTVSGSGISCGATCSKSFYQGSSVSLSATADSGSVFAGWSGTNCSSLYIDGNYSCTAVFNLNTYTLSVTTPGGGTVGGGGTYNSGTVVSLTATPSTGYVFSSWSGDSDCTDGSVTMNASKSCTGSFALGTFPVSYSITGSGAVTPATCLYSTATTPSCTPSTGWSTSSCPAQFNCDVTNSKSATFTANTYAVSFSNTGDGTCSSITPTSCTYGASVTPSCNASTGSYVNSCPGTFTCSTSNSFAGAICNLSSYTYYFDGNGATTNPSPTSTTAKYGASISSPSNPSRTGYTFSGWSPSIPSTMPAGGGTSYAQWTSSQCTGTPWGTVSNGFSGTAYSTSSPTYSTTCSAVSQTRTCTNGSMSGSYTNTSCTQGCDGGSFGAFANGQSTTGWSSSSAVYPSVCSSATRTCSGGSSSSYGTLSNSGYPYTSCTQYYVASFNSNGGSPSYSSSNYTSGATVSSPGTPTRAGYTFTGWSPALPSAMPSANTTYTAQWSLNTQAALSITSTTGTYPGTITLTTSGGSGTGAVTYVVDSAGTAGCSVAGSTLSYTSLGSCTVTATKAADANYTVAVSSPSTTITIKSVQATLNLSPQTVSYPTAFAALSTTGGSGGGAVTYSVTTSGTAGCSISGTTLSYTSVGTCGITATKAGDASYNQISSSEQTFTINKGTQTALSITSTSGTYPTNVSLATSGGSGGGSVSYAVTSSGTAGCSVNGSSLSFAAAGTCTVTATKAADSNYNAISSSATTITIALGTQTTLVVTAQTVSFPDPFSNLNYTGGSGSGAVTFALVSAGTAGCSVSGTTLSYTTTGTCTVSATKAADSGYSAASSAAQTFTVNVNARPGLTTPTSASITQSGATIGANIVSLGTPATISERGTCIGLTPNPTTNCLAEYPASPTVQALVVAGGGAGGGSMGGGGGAGGLLYNAALNVSVQSYSVTVGAGGSATNLGYGGNGGNSVFSTMTAIGGGGGGYYANNAGQSGGSGGGGGNVAGSGGSGTAGQGNSGGAGVSNNASGGGGGAGGAGQSGNSSTGAGGDGGIGLSYSISGTATYYAGGGGGSCYYGVNPGGGGAGNLGGGGSASCAEYGTGANGTANRGGGGGGSGYPSGLSGAGGSGIVIIRYPTGAMTATGGTITTSGSDTIHTFTSSGTFNVTALNNGFSTGTFTQARTGLLESTTYYYRAYAVNPTTGTGYSPDGTFTTLGKPLLADPTATSITSTGATLNSNVISLGNPASITARGICYGTTPLPTTNCTAASGTTKGAFSVNVAGLSAGVTYYYRGYATNSIGTGYSADGTFSVAGLPTLTTPTAASLSGSGAILGANITAIGGPGQILERGVCYGTSPNPSSTCVGELQSTIAPPTAKVLVVAGGGGGANTGSGGGGGGVVYNSSYGLVTGSYSVTVGAGGAGGQSTAAPGVKGGNSAFGAITAEGGGNGMSHGNCAGGNGGNGGGGPISTTCTATGGTGSQGYAGGAGYLQGSWSGGSGGGGGAGQAGTAGGNSAGMGKGGDGVSNSISGAAVYYGGGGGGGEVNGSYVGAGGLGGGGNANLNTTGNNGTNGLGGGGGGGSYTGTYFNGGNGGSGVVIISYPTGSMTATGGTVTTSGGNTIHTFTSNGTFSVTDIDQTYIKTGAFTMPVTGLSQNTTYYYRGYAKNITGIGYSPDGTFTMSGFPTLTTPTSASITTTGATIGANLTSAGSPSATEKGVCYGTTPNPTTCVVESTAGGSLPVQVLVVAGGGGGGIANPGGGGGGGGGVVYNPSFNVSVTSYPVTVGAGGTGNYNGENSVFSTITAIGGGAGGGATAWDAGDNGSSGGSGGGGGGQYYSAATGGSATAGQGNVGGTANTFGGGSYKGGGGGGAGGAGGASSNSSTASSNYGGDGGAGVAYSISGSSQYYGAGGGGNIYIENNYGLDGRSGYGGSGVGGTGEKYNNVAGYLTAATNGAANTGSGGGGGMIRGYGGSGIVIIRYPTGSMTATGGTITTSGSDTIHTFTSSGTFTVTAGGTINTGAYTKAITGLTPDTLYYYRGYATNSSGTAYSPDGTFSTTGDKTYNQLDYRLFYGNDGTNVTGAIASQNTPITLSKSNDNFRLRMLMGVGGSGTLAINGQSFKLQYAVKSGSCSASTYYDIAKNTPIAFYKNSTPNDKSSLTTSASDPTHSTDIIVNQSYVESNIFTNSVAAVPVGQDAKWDFSLYDKSTSSGVTYCIRAVYSDGRALTTYTNFPEITTAVYKSRGSGINHLETVGTGSGSTGGTGTKDNTNPIAPQCSDGIDNDGVEGIDAADPNCHINGVGDYVPTHNSETVSPTINTGGGGQGGGGGGDLGFFQNLKYIFRRVSSGTLLGTVVKSLAL